MKAYNTDIKVSLITITWRITLLFIAFLTFFFYPGYYPTFPYAQEELTRLGYPEWVYGFGNFDGVHYLRIARDLYEYQYTQAFFPLFPLLMKLIGGNLFISGLVIANLSFLVAVILFYKYIASEFDKRTAKRSVIFLLAVPTAFYFGALYTESLFFLFTIGFLILLKKEKFILAGVLAALASGTRIVGIFLFFVLLIELFLIIRKNGWKLDFKKSWGMILGILISPLGLLGYMGYLYKEFGDPLLFLTAQPAFGAGRSESLVLLPQVLYRYLNILFTVSIRSYPFFTAILELSFTLIALGLLIVYFKKMRLSHWVFSFGCIILPTLTGNLSSMPRYILMSFLLIPFLVNSLGKYFRIAVVVMALIQVILLGLFLKGYWVS